MHDKPTEPIRNDLRVLTSLELQARNLLALQQHVTRVLNDVQGKEPALTDNLRERMALCDLEALLDGAIRLRSALESKS